MQKLYQCYNNTLDLQQLVSPVFLLFFLYIIYYIFLLFYMSLTYHFPHTHNTHTQVVLNEIHFISKVIPLLLFLCV